MLALFQVPRKTDAGCSLPAGGAMVVLSLRVLVLGQVVEAHVEQTRALQRVEPD
jgi:hypothetical protein